MKNKILFLLLHLLFLNALWSQDQDKIYKIGFAGGPNISNFVGNDVHDSDSKTGMNVGLFYEPFFSDKFSIDAGIYYSQEGNKFKYEIYEVESKNNYINFPILAKYHFTPKFSFGLGPYFGFKVASKLEYDREINGSKSEENEFIQGLDLGLKGQLQYYISERVFMSVGYSYGLTKVYKESSFLVGNVIQTIKSPKIYNSFFNINMGYRFK